MVNSNIAFKQGADALQIGFRDGSDPLEIQWYDLRDALRLNSPSYVGYFDHFLGDLLRDEWATDLSTGATIATGSLEGGQAVFTLDTDDNDHATLALGLHWLVSNGGMFLEVAVKQITAITVRAVEVGFSDALSETNGLAFSGFATPTAVATDAAVFHYNTDDSMTTWGAISVNGGGTPQATTLTGAPSTSFSKLKLMVDSAGVAKFFVDGTLEATHSAAVATTGLLTPWITLKSLSAAAKVMHVDYVSVSGLRG